jgi:hypothetical protein
MRRNRYIHVCYKIDIKLFLGMKVFWNKIISNNFSYSYNFIPKKIIGEKEKFP